MIDEDTPRSYTSPRDDRFFTPRTIARSNSASNSDEWQTPRYEGEFQTPRSHYADGKDTARSYSSAHSYTSAKENYGDPSTYNSAKQFYSSGYEAQKGPVPSQSMASTKAPMRRQFIAEEEEEKYHYSESHEVDISAANIDEEDIENVFRYARHGRVEEIEKLLDKGVPIDIRDTFGNTLLTIACQNGNKRVAKLVLRRGANINGRNFKGNTPLHYCYHYGYGDTLGQYLISKGADSEARNNVGTYTWQGI